MIDPLSFVYGILFIITLGHILSSNTPQGPRV